MNDQVVPRRRKAVAAAPKERGLFMQLVFHSPKDALAGAVAVAAVLAIIVNAVFLQAGRHPSPLFGTTPPQAKSVSSAPAVQKAEVAIAAAQPMAAPPQAVASPMPRPRPVEAEVRPGDPLGNLVRSTSVVTTQSVGAPRPPAAIPAATAQAKADPAKADQVAGLIVSSHRVAAVQRALTDYGYGQIKVTGTVGADTQAAIQKFERERKLPLTGQMSERLVRELGLATGRSFE